MDGEFNPQITPVPSVGATGQAWITTMKKTNITIFTHIRHHFDGFGSFFVSIGDSVCREYGFNECEISSRNIFRPRFSEGSLQKLYDFQAGLEFRQIFDNYAMSASVKRLCSLA